MTLTNQAEKHTVGEIKKASEIGRKGYYKYILIICPDCNKTRWVVYTNNKPRNERCFYCAHKLRRNYQRINLIRKMYIDEQLSQRQIAAKLGVTQTAIKCYLKHYNIPTRSVIEGIRIAAKEGRIGPTNRKERVHKARGYMAILIKGHPRADNNGYVLEHIWVWEKVHKNPLPKGWIIHHLNGIKNDNRAENLIAMPRKNHSPLKQTEPY